MLDASPGEVRGKAKVRFKLPLWCEMQLRPHQAQETRPARRFDGLR